MTKEPTTKNTIGKEYAEWLQLNWNFLKTNFIKTNEKEFNKFCEKEYKKDD